jgi:hypothetical protein
MNAGFDGALGASDDVGDFLDREILKKMQNQNFAVLNAQAA